MSSLKKSLGILGTQRLLTIFISFVSSIIIARLLTPQEIGIYSVCVSVVGIAHVVREFGVGNYLIQEPELTRDRIKASLTILLTFAWVIALLLFIFKSTIARFYHDPRLENVIAVLALNFLFIPISSPVLSVLRRNLEFGKVAFINITASIAQNGASVVLAMLSFGPVSLAWGSFAGIIVTILLSIVFRPKEVPWMPGIKDIRRVASFGSKSSFGTVVNQAGYSAPDLIIGRVLSLADVGIYSRANGFASIITDQIGMLLHSTLFPTFSHESRAGIDVVRNFKNRTEMFTGIIGPALCFFGFAARPLIILLYGDTWLPAAPIASIICFAALISVPYTLSGSFLMAHGKVGFTAKMSMIVQLLNVLSVFVGAFFGLIFIPIFGIIVHLGRFFASRYAMKKFFGVSTRDILKVNVKSFAVAGMTLLPLAALSIFLPPSEDVHIVIPAYMATATIFWLSGIYLTGHALAHEINVVLKMLRQKFSTLRS
jgi:O-antigen/teichoic acid export membrane protein